MKKCYGCCVIEALKDGGRILEYFWKMKTTTRIRLWKKYMEERCPNCGEENE
jgi:hypothetical protein